MSLRNLKLDGWNGAALVEGQLSLTSDEPGGTYLKALSKGQMCVRFPKHAFTPLMITIHEKVEQAKDGFYITSRPKFSISFNRAFPSLQYTLSDLIPDEQGRCFFGLNANPIALLSEQRLEQETNHRQRFCGHLTQIDVIAQFLEDGLKLDMTGAVRANSYSSEPHLVEHSKFECSFLLPRAYCEIHNIYGKRSWSPRTEPVLGDWQPWNKGLGATATNGYRIFSEGNIDWQQKPDSQDISGPFVLINLSSDELKIEPVARIGITQSGYAQLISHPTNMPEIVLPLGHKVLSRIMFQKEQARIDLGGSGIGYLDGQTGRAVFECGGPMRQHLNTLKAQLTRTKSGLKIEAHCQISPLEGNDAHRSRGPQLSFDFEIPRGWILAKGLDFPEFVKDWRAENRNDL